MDILFNSSGTYKVYITACRVRIDLSNIVIMKAIVYRNVGKLQWHIVLNFHMPCQSLHVLQSRVLAGVRCVDAQTLQAYSPVCPGKVPREQVHLAHMLGALWLFGLLCADWLGFFSSFFLFLFSKIMKHWRILLWRGYCLNKSSDRKPQKSPFVRSFGFVGSFHSFSFVTEGPWQKKKCQI